MRIMDIVEDMMFSNFLSVNSRVTHIHYIRVIKMMSKHQSVLRYLVKLEKDALASKTLGTVHLDDGSRYIFSDGDISLMFQADDSSAKNGHKPALFHAISIYRRSKSLLDLFHLGSLEQTKKRLPAFLLFLDR